MADDVPTAKPWFFHNSALNLYDRNALVPKPNRGARSWHAFSSRDNEALCRAWDARHKDKEETPSGVVVGADRLYVADIIKMSIDPIYWTPVQVDEAQIVRGEWFHSSTGELVEEALAQDLEDGYRELRPWSSTYRHEVMSALKLKDADADKRLKWLTRNVGRAVYYQNDSKAWLVNESRTGLSLFVGRTNPLEQLDTKDRVVGGECIVRGYDALDRDLVESTHDMHEDDIEPVTDLVLVVHGIGQKLSERMEGFKFSHAINTFRVLMASQMYSDNVRIHLRAGFRPQILPVNWRSGVNLDFDSPSSVLEDSRATSTNFTLADIFPPTIPAVRNIIKDVMLDIPIYLSHYREKMTTAVVLEANRIFRLFCMHNPDFERQGRVHIIGHSLGCALTMDILSAQPTALEGTDNPSNFAFNTTNLFWCGSPASLFLLLRQANLVPRRGRQKASSPESHYGDQGQFGCLAVDNIYNIFDVNDPIALQVNAAVDAQYAKLIAPTQLPSAVAPSSIPSISVPDILPSLSSPEDIKSVPAVIELESHNFDKENEAERRFRCLNDYGSLDYSYDSSMSWVEGRNQYIAMLGAHSRYWDSLDLARFIVTEIGRESGINGCVPSLVVRRAFAEIMIKMWLH